MWVSAALKVCVAGITQSTIPRLPRSLSYDMKGTVASADEAIFHVVEKYAIASGKKNRNRMQVVPVEPTWATSPKNVRARMRNQRQEAEILLKLMIVKLLPLA